MSYSINGSKNSIFYSFPQNSAQAHPSKNSSNFDSNEEINGQTDSAKNSLEYILNPESDSSTHRNDQVPKKDSLDYILNKKSSMDEDSQETRSLKQWISEQMPQQQIPVESNANFEHPKEPGYYSLSKQSSARKEDSSESETSPSSPSYSNTDQPIMVFSMRGIPVLPISPLKRKKESPSRLDQKKHKTSEEIDCTNDIGSQNEASKLMKKFSKKIFKGDEAIIEKYREKSFNCAYYGKRTWSFKTGGLLHLILHALYTENDADKIKVLSTNLQMIKTKVEEKPDAFPSNEIEGFHRAEKIHIVEVLSELSKRILTFEEFKTLFERTEKYRASEGQNVLHLLVKKMFNTHKDGKRNSYQNYIKIKQFIENPLSHQTETSLLHSTNHDGFNFIEYFDDCMFKDLEGYFRTSYRKNKVLERFFKRDCSFKYTFEASSEDKYVKGDSILHFLIRKIFNPNNFNNIDTILKNAVVVTQIVFENLEDKDIRNLARHKNSENEDFQDLFSKLKSEYDEKNRHMPLEEFFSLVDKTIPENNVNYLIHHAQYLYLCGMIDQFKDNINSHDTQAIAIALHPVQQSPIHPPFPRQQRRPQAPSEKITAQVVPILRNIPKNNITSPSPFQSPFVPQRQGATQDKRGSNPSSGAWAFFPLDKDSTPSNSSRRVSSRKWGFVSSTGAYKPKETE